MRVAMIVWNDLRNDARVRKEAETLQAAGHAVTVFALHSPGLTQARETILNGVEVVRTPRRPFEKPAKRTGKPMRLGRAALLTRTVLRSWTHAMMLVRIVRSHPDIVHAHDVNTLPTGWLAARLARAQLVYDAHEISTGREGYRKLRGLVFAIERRLMPRAAGTITTTDRRAAFFARAYGISRPLVLQNRPARTSVERTGLLREELGLRRDWPVIVYQGGLQQGRGLETLLAAMAGVPDAHLVFIGSGRLSESLTDKARELALDDRVRFVPTVPLERLPVYTASADIGVQPIENTCLNHFTTDSNKLFEYVMAGLPVVASNLPEIRRIVNEHELGLLVPDGDEGALAAALRRLVLDAAERERLARNARAAAPLLSWESQAPALVELYRRLGAGTDRPGESQSRNEQG